jgi:uncharacterized DUF497 family protein
VSAPTFTSILWDRDDDPRGNVQHIARHHLTMDEVEDVFQKPTGWATSRSSGRPMIFGETRTGRYIGVVYEVEDASTAYPITAFDARRPIRKRR